MGFHLDVSAVGHFVAPVGIVGVIAVRAVYFPVVIGILQFRFTFPLHVLIKEQCVGFV